MAGITIERILNKFTESSTRVTAKLTANQLVPAFMDIYVDPLFQPDLFNYFF